MSRLDLPRELLHTTDLPNLSIGFGLGILASGTAWLLSEYAVRPLLDIIVDPNRSQGQNPGPHPHEFYHVRVRNLPARWPLPGRRPAWSCRGTIEVLRPDGSRAVPEEIQARWTSQPEPLLPVIAGHHVGSVLDPSRLMQARKIDVHSHFDEPMSLAVKFEGEEDCYVFSNESYLFPRWQNPAWRLNRGAHLIRVTVYYERGYAQRDFELRNDGLSRDDVHIRPWPAAA